MNKGMEMKKLQIGRRAQAEKVLVDSLFKPVSGRTLTTMKYDGGKYRAGAHLIGKEVEVSDDVFALYPVKRHDSYGPYTQIMCVCSA